MRKERCVKNMSQLRLPVGHPNPRDKGAHFGHILSMRKGDSAADHDPVQ